MSSHILSHKEAIEGLDLDKDSNMSGLDDKLASVDAYIFEATGYTWQSDSEINTTAKSVAQLILKFEYEGACDKQLERQITKRLLQLRLQ